jgi:hypothetical protein
MIIELDQGIGLLNGLVFRVHVTVVYARDWIGDAPSSWEAHFIYLQSLVH